MSFVPLTTENLQPAPGPYDPAIAADCFILSTKIVYRIDMPGPEAIAKDQAVLGSGFGGYRQWILSWKNGQPEAMLCLDKKAKSATLVFRGTKTLNDVFVDLSFYGVPASYVFDVRCRSLIVQTSHARGGLPQNECAIRCSACAGFKHQDRI